MVQILFFSAETTKTIGTKRKLPMQFLLICIYLSTCLSHHFCSTGILPLARPSAFVGYMLQICLLVFLHTTFLFVKPPVFISLSHSQDSFLLCCPQCYLWLGAHHSRASEFLNPVMYICCIPVQCQIQICDPGANGSLNLFSCYSSFVFGPAKLSKEEFQ